MILENCSLCIEPDEPDDSKRIARGKGRQETRSVKLTDPALMLRTVIATKRPWKGS